MEEKAMKQERKVYGEHGFKHELSPPFHQGQIARLVLGKEIEIETELHEFHEDVAKELDFRDFSEYIAFCMKELARYWLEVDPKRFGELMAEAKSRQHLLHNISLDD
jgi:hypothetical protein